MNKISSFCSMCYITSEVNIYVTHLHQLCNSLGIFVVVFSIYLILTLSIFLLRSIVTTIVFFHWPHLVQFCYVSNFKFTIFISCGTVHRQNIFKGTSFDWTKYNHKTLPLLLWVCMMLAYSHPETNWNNIKTT